MKITFKAQLPGKWSSWKGGPSATTECKALSYLLWKQPPAQSSTLSHCKGENARVCRWKCRPAKLPSSTFNSRIQCEIPPTGVRKDVSLAFGGFSAKSLEMVCCFSRNSWNSAISSAHSTSQFDLLDNIKVWSWTSDWRHWGPSEILSWDHRTLRAFVTSQLHWLLSLPVSPKSQMAFLRGCMTAQM